MNKRRPPLGFLPARSPEVRTDENHNPSGVGDRVFQFVV
jgi:hypothetical protein